MNVAAALTPRLRASPQELEALGAKVRFFFEHKPGPPLFCPFCEECFEGEARCPEHDIPLVPFEDLVGRADRIMFSSAGRSMLFFWTWRSDRFFKGIE